MTLRTKSTISKRKLSEKDTPVPMSKRQEYSNKKDQNKESKIIGYNKLKEDHEKLLVEYQNTLKTIETLKLKLLESESKEQKSSSTVETQTVYSYGDFEIPCKECIFKATCEDELMWHIKSEHGMSDLLYDDEFSCDICSKKFQGGDDLSTHKKNIIK